MGDLISRKALLNIIPKKRDLSSEIGRRTAAAIRRIIANAPSVDAEPVRHGWWKSMGDCGVTECSMCKWSIEEYVGDY